MKATPCVPVAVVELVMTGTGGLTVMVNVLLPVPPALLALMVIEDVPVLGGVPEITPVAVLTLNHPGRFVALKFVGELVAVMV